jgi:23S rRNA (cytosine1962-C5)-methyltransferase
VAARSHIKTRLRKPLARSVRSGHPWLYREALEPFEAAPGSVVTVLDERKRVLCRGLADSGPIGLRVFTTEDEPLDARLLARRIESAFALRARVVPAETDAYRLLHGEGDRLPGVVCDRYGHTAVLKLDGDAACAWRGELCDALRAPLAALGVETLLVREGRKHEQQVELAHGSPPPHELVILERGMRLCVDLWHGQKTGLFLDHRESRFRVRGLAAGARVLNLYGYTGGFSVAAGLGGALHVDTIDVAAPALALAERSWAQNALPVERHQSRAADVPDLLTELTATRARFELVVADPPSFAPNERSKPAALASYGKLHAACLGLLEPGGIYVAASCSSHVAAEDFDATLREGARAARRVLQVLERSGAPADHPRLLAFPEGDYLKVVVSRIVG